MPADCGNLKDYIKKALGEMRAGQVDGPLLVAMYGENSGILENVKWTNDKEWNLVKNDLRLIRSFSFIGEYHEPVDDIHSSYTNTTQLDDSFSTLNALLRQSSNLSRAF